MFFMTPQRQRHGDTLLAGFAFFRCSCGTLDSFPGFAQATLLVFASAAAGTRFVAPDLMRHGGDRIGQLGLQTFAGLRQEMPCIEGLQDEMAGLQLPI